MTTKTTQPDRCGLSCRDFLKYSAAIGGSAALVGSLPHVQQIWAQSESTDPFRLGNPELSKELAADTDAVVAGEMTIDEFKSKHAAHLDVLIDPDHPDKGPVNNQFVFLGGRIEHGRKELCKRFLYDSFGSTNFYLHTTICEQSHHVSYKMMSGNKDHMKADTMNSEFIIFFGTSPF